jgi:acyl-coenzyme A thioesterase PaaI-like protein
VQTPQFAKTLLNTIPANVKETLKLRTFGFLKIPVLFFVSPTVVELDDYRCVVKIPLTRRSKNHLGSMYFGVLAAGADCAGGLMAMKLIDEAPSRGRNRGKINLIFKDFKAEFLKRAEGDVLFTCEDGLAIRQLVERVSASDERESMPVQVTATVPSKLGNEPVARFTLTLSLKRKS